MWIKSESSVAYRPHRRAASVPARTVSSLPTDDVGIRVTRYDIGSGVAANKARVIASYVNEDTDAIAAASKRNDHAFLYDVSTKLANLSNSNSLPPRSSRSVPPSVRQRPSLPLPASTPISSYLRHSAALTPEDNYDIAAYLQRTPSTSTRPSVLSSSSYRNVTGRATSLPPPSVHQPVRPSVPRWYPSSVTYYGRSARGVDAAPSWSASRSTSAPPLPVGLPPRLPTGDRKDAITDSVVGVAHTALYGDIVIGIPYKKRYMYSVQREFDDLDTQSLPAIHLPVQTRVSSAPRFAKPRPASIALPSGAPELIKPRSRASYAGPVGSGAGYRPLARRGGGLHQSIGGLQSGAVSSSAAAADLDDTISIKSYPGAFAGGRSAIKASRRPLTGVDHYHVDDLENDVDLLDFDDSGAVSQLSSLKRDAKSILNRYTLPPQKATSNGPKYMTTSELDQKYGQILSSMQAHNKLPPRTENVTSALPSYQSTSRKPPMSDTRKKLRDILCRSRNDPHYFDS